MGKLNVFAISLPNQYAVYHAGEVVQGHVLVELNEPMKMRGVRIELKGFAYVHWTEQHTTHTGKSSHTTTRHYSATENYFHHIITLFGKGPNDRGDDPTLPAGSHTFPFSFQLPHGLPSSFEGDWGHVRYSMLGTIDKPWKFDHHTKRAFTVLSVLDLNTRPDAAMGMEGQNSKTLCCLCCASGPITAKISIPKKGYVPGETIHVTAEVNNHSSRKMDRVMFVLRQSIAFHATTKTRYSSKNVLNIVKGEVAPGDSEAWRNETIIIPPIPPSELVGCRIIDIQYYMCIVVDPSGPAFDLEVPLEILVGTVPLRTTYPQYGFGANYNTVYSSNQPPPPLPVQPSAPPTDAAVPPPPSYSACVFGAVDIKDDADNEYTKGDLQYTPVYTYYDRI
ncbi:arrestin domain-containing protein 3 [Lingula anatina]|uniref:Arrestin domain-containing protein 3 n=1 Tax=Lingula anatina TaxID=7574 RepID=A0A1S3K5A5_LINAN|nr:arrestin domain-containing protein 3 [Lingula anatina]|eukprot:XP_013417446.1 arrestin domain-containing protein 3 [Lingula anatina]